MNENRLSYLLERNKSDPEIWCKDLALFNTYPDDKSCVAAILNERSKSNNTTSTTKVENVQNYTDNRVNNIIEHEKRRLSYYETQLKRASMKSSAYVEKPVQQTSNLAEKERARIQFFEKKLEKVDTQENNGFFGAFRQFKSFTLFKDSLAEELVESDGENDFIDTTPATSKEEESNSILHQVYDLERKNRLLESRIRCKILRLEDSLNINKKAKTEKPLFFPRFQSLKSFFPDMEEEMKESTARFEATNLPPDLPRYV